MACLEKERERGPARYRELAALLDAVRTCGPGAAADAKEWWGLHHPAPAPGRRRERGGPPPQTQVRMAMAVSALMMAHQVAGKAARDGIFLSQFRTSALPENGGRRRPGRSDQQRPARPDAGAHRAAAHHRDLVRRQRSPAGGRVAAVAYHPQIAACVIYLHVVAFGAILLSGFWSLMNESFDPREAKRMFGQISGMGTLGGLAGGILASRVAAWVSVPAVVLMLALLHLLCAALLWRAFPTSAAAARDSAPAQYRHRNGGTRRYPFLLTLAGLVLAASAGTALLDFVFKAQAAQTFGRGSPLLRVLRTVLHGHQPAHLSGADIRYALRRPARRSRGLLRRPARVHRGRQRRRDPHSRLRLPRRRPRHWRS